MFFSENIRQKTGINHMINPGFTVKKGALFFHHFSDIFFISGCDF